MNDDVVELMNDNDLNFVTNDLITLPNTSRKHKKIFGVDHDGSFLNTRYDHIWKEFGEKPET